MSTRAAAHTSREAAATVFSALRD